MAKTKRSGAERDKRNAAARVAREEYLSELLEEHAGLFSLAVKMLTLKRRSAEEGEDGKRIAYAYAYDVCFDQLFEDLGLDSHWRSDVAERVRSVDSPSWPAVARARRIISARLRRESKGREQKT